MDSESSKPTNVGSNDQLGVQPERVTAEWQRGYNEGYQSGSRDEKLISTCATEDDRPLATRIWEALPEEPKGVTGWARYGNECVDFVARLRLSLKAKRNERA